ncbi:hypothetical protein ACFBZI_07165 [Moraxella sp. ZJ142]|uniref:hypothetical protein n=1 Tax=Moraxella marmotae TaxID=3344520 RepID=UPI0035D4381E
MKHPAKLSYEDKMREYRSMMFWARFCQISPFVAVLIVWCLINFGLDGGFALILLFIYFYIVGAIALAKSTCPFCGGLFHQTDSDFDRGLSFYKTCRQCGEPHNH